MSRRIGRVDVDWMTPVGNDFQWQHVQVEVLMDIRRELQRLNSVIQCSNFTRIPGVLDAIAKNTRKRKRKKIAARPKLRVVR